MYNNAKNTNTDRTLYKLNCNFHLQVLFKEDVNPCSKFSLAKKLANKLREWIKIDYQILLLA